MHYDLAVVIPVYNEEACIENVVQSWLVMLDRLSVQYHMLVLNDGSTDETLSHLTAFDHPRLEVVDKPNSGHGPTILQGYHRAVQVADWVFQCDSDDEMKPDAFPILWEHRQTFDAMFGMRTQRTQNVSRKFISAFSRWTVRRLFGTGMQDVNTPYRLIRASVLKKIIERIPNDTIAPNILISGALIKQQYKIFYHPVQHEGRRTGSVSIVKWKLWKIAMKSFWQTITHRK